jgi:trimeric autotransporter adhesin
MKREIKTTKTQRTQRIFMIFLCALCVFVVFSSPLSLRQVTLGPPEISSLSQDRDKIEGGAEVIIKGKNFSPDSLVVLGEIPATDVLVESETTIRFRVPRQTATGGKTLTVRTPGGVAQHDFNIIPKPLSELASGEITTVAGPISFVGDGGLATLAGLDRPIGLAVDAAGNLFIADTDNNRIRRVDVATGIITTVAGNGRQGFSGDGGPAISAGLNVPTGVAVDRAGNLFITDAESNRIRRIDAVTGVITTVVGNGNPNFSGDGGPAISASLDRPSGLAVDDAGNLFIADRDNNRIRRVDAVTGIITTVAGNGNPIFSSDGGSAISAGLGFPPAVTVDTAGNLFIADLNSRIRRVDAVTGIITTVAGNGRPGFSGDGGPATSAGLGLPRSVAVDAAGNLFIADADNNRIRRVDAVTGIITTVAGNGIQAFSGDGGPAISAGLDRPTGVTVDGTGILSISDFNNNRIRRVDAATGIITTVAGDGRTGFNGDGGLATSTGLNFPRSVAVDRASNLFITDFNNNRIRRIDAATGIITKVAGDERTGFSGDGGPAANALLNRPSGLAVDGTGNLFIADFNNNRIRRVDAATVVITTVVGIGSPIFGGDGGPALSAGVNRPIAVAVDGAGNLFLTDLDNHIRRVDAATGIITTAAGNGSQAFSGDGGPARSAGLNFPRSIAVDGTGNLFIADFNNNRIRRVDAATGIIRTVAGNGISGFSGDGGPAISASLNGPLSIAVDAEGNLFIADAQNILIRRVDAATGIITTVAGNGSQSFSGDGGPARMAGFDPAGIAVDSAGNLFIADAQNNRIRAVKGIAKGQGEQRQVTINKVSFSKSDLTISGSGFTVFGASVVINGKNTSNFITSQNDNIIVLKGKKKKLNLKNGPNQIIVTTGGATSNTFTFNLFAE